MGKLRVCDHGEASSLCGICEPARARARYHANPDGYRDAFLRRNYGITLAEYEIMLAAQGSVCAICGGVETRRVKGGKIGCLMVDHDHETGRVRGLLCHKCNAALGYLADDPDRLRRAADYLEGT